MTAARLLKAARAGDEAEIEALITQGTKGTRKQLIEAARAGEADVVDVLVRSGTRGTRNELLKARAAGDARLEEALLRSGAGGDAGRVIVALLRKDWEGVEALRREGAMAPHILKEALKDALARRDGRAIEALSHTRAPLQEELERAIANDDVDRARVLLAHGRVDPNARLSAGYFARYPLIALANSPAMLDALVDGGADINTPPPRGGFSLIRHFCSKTVLNWYAVASGGQAEKIELLRLALALGMDPNARDHDGWTALEFIVYASRNLQANYGPSHRAIIEALVNAGAETRGALDLAQGDAFDCLAEAVLEHDPNMAPVIEGARDRHARHDGRPRAPRLALVKDDRTP